MNCIFEWQIKYCFCHHFATIFCYDLLLFIEEIHMNNTVAVICSKMQNSKQIFQ